jgi:hypothetical protein
LLKKRCRPEGCRYEKMGFHTDSSARRTDTVDLSYCCALHAEEPQHSDH